MTPVDLVHDNPKMTVLLSTFNTSSIRTAP
jgi:hypothetical protein